MPLNHSDSVLLKSGDITKKAKIAELPLLYRPTSIYIYHSHASALASDQHVLLPFIINMRAAGEDVNINISQNIKWRNMGKQRV